MKIDYINGVLKKIVWFPIALLLLSGWTLAWWLDGCRPNTWKRLFTPFFKENDQDLDSY